MSPASRFSSNSGARITRGDGASERKPPVDGSTDANGTNSRKQRSPCSREPMQYETAVFPAKKIATKVKHHILESCLKAWGGIIIASNAGRQVRLAFVDTCCG